MKKIIYSILFYALAVPVALAAGPGTPGDGFETGDPCGYLTGSSTSPTDAGTELNTGGNVYLDLGATYRSYQACVKTNGYFYSNYSYVWNNQVGWIDFNWTRPSSMSVADYYTYLPNVDQSTGEWTGYAWNEIIGWVQLDWSCTSSCATSERVITDTTGGSVTGYGWNDQIGWISFYSLAQELPPYDVTASVTIETGDGYAPSEITPENAPYSDGFQYYKIKLVLTNNDTGESLTSSDLSTVRVAVNTTSDTNVYLDQIHGRGLATLASKTNKALTDCESLSSSVYSCEIIDSDGETSFNYFIYSNAPTSDMLGIDSDADGSFDIYNDRDYGASIYESPTGDGTSSSDRVTAFYNRDAARNKYEISSIDFSVALVDTSRELTVSGLTDSGAGSCGLTTDCEEYTYTPDADVNLSYRPRFQNTSFVTYYDGEEKETIADYDSSSTGMYVRSYATIAPTSDEFQAVNGSGTGRTYRVHYEAASDATDDADLKFLIDTNNPEDDVMNGRYRDNDFNRIPGSSTYYYGGGGVGTYIDYRIGYGQEYSGVYTATPTNPTLEQWVCDEITADPQTESLVMEESVNSGVLSCYFTGYLPRLDRHADAEDMLLVGAINASIDEDVVSEQDDVSVLGVANYVNLRNTLYAQIARLVRNQTPKNTAVCGSLSSRMNAQNSGSCKTTGISTLMNGLLLYAESDVYVGGSTSFTDKTLVVNGADVYIEGNVYGGKLGIVVLKDDGKGGNVYISPDVTDLYANIFADGSVFNESDTTSSGVPTWSSGDARTDALLNQLYIKGSIISRNTIGGASGSATSPYNLGDGTTSTSVTTAEEYDFNKFREFRLCYPLDSGGNVDETGTTTDCDEGESRSAEYTGTSDSPLIVEYDPPSASMPIYNNSGLNIGGL
ncbi:hypothetical protein HY463_01495 [Candidatus Peregrinibacteria bacterium]|nr:hypothetical protein [Candidatus Peregrinibacteria bacterium]